MDIQINFNALVRDISRFLPEKAYAELASNVLPGLSAAAVVYWKQLAQTRLHTSSRDYAQGIQLRVISPTLHEVELLGMLPNMIENGFLGGDMREWMLKSAKVKQGKNGPYLVVPFRHGAPGTGGRNVGLPMPKAIHEVAKRMAGTVTDGAGRRHWGERLDHATIEDKRAALKRGVADRAVELLDTRQREWHAVSLWQGMVRNQKTYEKATQSSYTTFRTISMHKSDPRSWFHTGIIARQLAPQVTQHLSSIVGAVIEKALHVEP